MMIGEVLQDQNLSATTLDAAFFQFEEYSATPKIAEEVPQEKKEHFLSQCVQEILQNIDRPELGVGFLSRKLLMSHSSLYKKLKGWMGMSINEFIRFVRLSYASEMLLSSTYKVNEVAYRAGFNDIRYFRKQFKNLYKDTPSAFRKRKNRGGR